MVTRSSRRGPVISSMSRSARVASRWRLAVLIALVAVCLRVALTVHLPDSAQVHGMIDGYGWAAPLVFIAGYALVTLAPVPKNVLSAAAGLLFGPVTGALVVWVAALIGALIAFALGRLLGREAVERLTSTRVRQVDDLVAEWGLLTMVLLRLVPVVPFTAINYTAGLTRIRWWHYTLGTAVGIIPGTVAYVALGAYGTRPGSWPFLVSAVALFLLSAGGLLLARRRKLQLSNR